MPLTSLSELLGRGGRNIGTPRLQLPDSVVTHDSIDHMQFKMFAMDSPRFQHVAIDNAPQVPVDAKDPEPIDMSTTTPEEFLAYQQELRAAKEARENAPPYVNWPKLTRDLFYSYHTHDAPQMVEPVDPGVELHKRILPKIINTDEHAAARNSTRDDKVMSAIATMTYAKHLVPILENELSTQAGEAQNYESKVRDVQDIIDQLGQARAEAKDHIDQGQPVPDDLKGQIKELVQGKHAAQQAAADAAAQQTPMTNEAMQALAQAATAAKEAAEAAKGLPSFGSGLGPGEPTYESPEQALSIAEMWANNPLLKQIAERFGRMDPDIRFHRAKRIEGGNDEIVDVEFGDNLNRVLPDELAMFADDDYELDFLSRFADAELLQFSTVGEENAGRGPIIAVVDGSGSMSGERNIWTRALAMVLLHIARLEKRDFACIEFASARQVEEWVFRANEPMDAQRIVEMASHFFGGGTSPIQGVAGAVKLMEDAPPFKKADLVMIGDGEAGFGPEDKMMRDKLTGMGVRIFGIAIGTGTFRYLVEYAEHVVHVHDFELQDPSQATAELATHVT